MLLVLSVIQVVQLVLPVYWVLLVPLVFRDPLVLLVFRDLKVLLALLAALQVLLD